MRSFLVTIFALVSFALFVAGNPEPAPEPVPEPGGRRAPCKGNTIGFCSTGKSCIRGRQGYYCKAGALAAKPAGPSASARYAKREVAFCHEGTVACPIMRGGLHGGFECVSIQTDIEQCGDCAVLGGTDCTSIPGVADVACVAGFCRVEACASGYVFDFRKRSCVPNSFWQVQPNLNGHHE
ncbi:hypothetical protein JCM16303_006677 [Sporobolomyces ruberrimus]